MKKGILFVVAGLALFLYGCGPSAYGVVKEGSVKGDLKKYKVINVAWVDLNENKWKDYGYESKKQWVAVINDMNKKSLPQYLKEAMPAKKTIVVSSRNIQPAKNGLVVKFSKVEYMQQTSTAAKVMFGAFAGSDTLDLTVHFIDGATSKELYQATLSVNTEGWMDTGFEGRVNNSIYNLAYYIAEKVN